MQTDKTNENTDMATFLGYEEVKLSRPVNGKTSVKVKCLPVRKLAEYAALFDIEPELIGLATELSAEEIDMLSAEDSGRIFEKIHELNFDPFSAWLKRKAAAARMKARAYGIDLPETTPQNSGGNSANSPDGLPQTRE